MMCVCIYIHMYGFVRGNKGRKCRAPTLTRRGFFQIQGNLTCKKTHPPRTLLQA